MLISVAVFKLRLCVVMFACFLAETFGGKAAQQGNSVQEETAGNRRADSRIWSLAANRGGSQTEARDRPAETGNFTSCFEILLKNGSNHPYQEKKLISYTVTG